MYAAANVPLPTDKSYFSLVRYWNSDKVSDAQRQVGIAAVADKQYSEVVMLGTLASLVYPPLSYFVISGQIYHSLSKGDAKEALIVAGSALLFSAAFGRIEVPDGVVRIDPINIQDEAGGTMIFGEGSHIYANADGELLLAIPDGEPIPFVDSEGNPIVVSDGVGKLINAGIEPEKIQALLARGVWV